jgi:hypothetical protein
MRASTSIDQNLSRTRVPGNSKDALGLVVGRKSTPSTIERDSKPGQPVDGTICKPNVASRGCKTTFDQ